MRFIRVFTVILLLGLLMAPVFEANPGGNGDSTRDFACGGACHADPDLSAPSSAQIVLVADRNETFVGGPLTVTATITGMELSDSRLIGVFLTVATFGADDSPDHAGWIIASDPNGGTSNYIERHVLDANRGVEISWALSAPMDESSHTFHIGVHHGGDGIARLASTEASGGIDIDVGPIPENFPQIDESWQPPTMRGLGEETMIKTVLLNVTNAQLEWRVSGSLQTNIIEATQENNVWNASLPAALGPVIIEYRWLLSNEDHDTTTAWTTLSAEEISSIDVNPARILMIALAMSTAGLLIGIQRRLAVSLADSETFEYPPRDSIEGDL
jgi:hypothetical protein